MNADDYVICADEKTSIQGLPPAPNRSMHVEHEDSRMEAWTPL
jgi:hypothetical protein